MRSYVERCLEAVIRLDKNVRSLEKLRLCCGSAEGYPRMYFNYTGPCRSPASSFKTRQMVYHGITAEWKKPGEGNVVPSGRRPISNQ